MSPRIATSWHSVVLRRDTTYCEKSKTFFNILLVCFCSAYTQNTGEQMLHRELLRLGLEGAGYTVRETKHGRDGTREFRKTPIDLVITDLYMPFCDGLDVIRRLRRLHSKLPILAISGGSGTMDYLNLARSEGASGVLYKPFTIWIVLQTVAELLGEPAPVS